MKIITKVYTLLLMNKKFYFLCAIRILVGLNIVSAQNSKIDSIKFVIKNAKHDSIKVIGYRQWDNLIYYANPDLDLELNNKMASICKNNLKKKLNFKEQCFFRENLANVYNNLGVIYTDRGNYIDGLSFYNKALKLQEVVNDKEGMAKCYNNIGIIYQNQGEFSKAIEYLENGLKMRNQVGDSAGIANSYTNIGNNYKKQGSFDTAMVYFNYALDLRKRLGDPIEIGYSLNFIAGIYVEKKDFENALKLIFQVMKIFERNGEEAGMASTNINVGNILNKSGKYREAISHANISIQLAIKHNEVLFLRDANYVLYEAYKNLGNFKSAILAYENYVLYRDSITNLQNQRATIQQQFKYSYEKKALADSVVNAKKVEITNAQIAKQKAELIAKRNQQIFLFAGLSLVIVFALFMYNRFKITSRQKKEIEMQKQLVEEKQKEILDSIYYARRIQQALLPQEKYIEKNLKNKS